MHDATQSRGIETQSQHKIARLLQISLVHLPHCLYCPVLDLALLFKQLAAATQERHRVGRNQHSSANGNIHAASKGR